MPQPPSPPCLSRRHLAAPPGAARGRQPRTAEPRSLWQRQVALLLALLLAGAAADRPVIVQEQAKRAKRPFHQRFRSRSSTAARRHQKEPPSDGDGSGGAPVHSRHIRSVSHSAEHLEHGGPVEHQVSLVDVVGVNTSSLNALSMRHLEQGKQLDEDRLPANTSTSPSSGNHTFEYSVNTSTGPSSGNHTFGYSVENDGSGTGANKDGLSGDGTASTYPSSGNHTFGTSSSLAASWMPEALLHMNIHSIRVDSDPWYVFMTIVVSLLGFVLLWLAVPLLWTAERLRAAAGSLRAYAGTALGDVDAEAPDPEHDGRLVHVHGEIRGRTSIFDRSFEALGFEDGCIKLRTTCEVYRWVEQCEASPHQSSGNTSDHIYTYSKAWCKSFVSDSRFQDACGHSNGPRPDIPLGVKTETCANVVFGKCTLAQCMLDSVDKFTDISEHIGNSVIAKMTSHPLQFELGQNGYYVARVVRQLIGGSAGGEGEHSVGDLRLRVEAVLDGPATVLAVQRHYCNRATFVPYRPISRRLCNWTDFEERAALLHESSKTYKELGDSWMSVREGFLGCLCLCCNIAARCIDTQGQCIEIHWLAHGHKSLEESVRGALELAAATVWQLRLLGSLLTWLAFLAALSALRAGLGWDVFAAWWPRVGSEQLLLVEESAFCVVLLWAGAAAIARFIFQPWLGLFLMFLVVFGTAGFVVALLYIRGGLGPASSL